MNTITMLWDGSKGGRYRTKTISANRRDEYLSYGWSIVEIEQTPLPVEKPVEVSVPLQPTFTEKELDLIAESAKPVKQQDLKKRGRPARLGR